MALAIPLIQVSFMTSVGGPLHRYQSRFCGAIRLAILCICEPGRKSRFCRAIRLGFDLIVRLGAICYGPQM